MSFVNFHQINGKTRKPLASGFKLTVLNELSDRIIDGTHTWTETFPITDAWKSIPTGVMQNFEDGTEVSLLEYAQYMIEISDNTAADHLIMILTKENIEKQFTTLENGYNNYTFPLLLTSECFKIKWSLNANDRQNYINSNEDTRTTILSNIVDYLSLSSINETVIEPVAIYDLEWFGSPAYQCQAMFALRNKTDQTAVKQILNLNTPFIDITTSNSFWSYAGFKGGSEPGVYTYTYLLLTQDNTWGCVSLQLANKDTYINEWVANDFLSKVLLVSEQIISSSFVLINFVLIFIVLVLYI